MIFIWYPEDNISLAVVLKLQYAIAIANITGFEVSATTSQLWSLAV